MGVFTLLINKEILEILYSELPPVIEKPYDKVLDSCKYVRLARKYNYSNYRFMRYQDLKKYKVDKIISDYNKKFITGLGAVLVIFNTIDGHPVSAVLRSIFNKEFSDIRFINSLYGMDFFDSSFKYGDYVIIVEGIYDADVLRTIYPNVLSAQTSSISYMQAEILSTLTDKFIIAFDSDDAGVNGYYKSVNKLKSAKRIDRLEVYGKDKDVGELETFTGKEYDKRYNYYSTCIDNIIYDNRHLDIYL